ncbi:MAG: (2Fe-2S)-binding protein [Nitrospinaceae bacterium]
MSSQAQLIDHFKKVCICRSITGGAITKAIREGCLSFEALRRKIRVGTGQCGAKRCRKKIEERVRVHKASLQTEAETVQPSSSETIG